jgi:hypothetical protein
MPDFSASFTAGATLVAWTDPPDVPPDALRPSRLNPIVGHGHQRRVGLVGVPVTITAKVGSVTAPADSALGGRLFVGTLAETPGSVPVITATPKTSVQTFTPAVRGHYTFALRRQGGGGLFLHLDVA